MSKPIVAMMYDFDKTLCTKDMQEYTFIPQVGMKSEDFWNETGDLAQKENMDRILTYLYYMLKKARQMDVPIHRHTFVEAGKAIELFPGVESFFQRMNAYGESLGISIEHYIISSGLKEIIEGSSIKDEFKRIYACEFHYDVNGIADWPGLVVNYTTKTQFLFRINKGVLDLYDDAPLNEYTPDRDRRIPFRNMIYFGDGLTDVPCMKLVKVNGGQSIAVYTDSSQANARKLLQDGRVDFMLPANYEEGSELDTTVKLILDKMAIVNQLVKKNHQQKG